MTALTLEQIRDVDLYFNHPGLDKKLGVQAWINAYNNPAVTVLRSGDSLMMLRDLGGGRGSFHFVNADPFDKFADNVSNVMTQAKSLGFVYLETNFHNPRVIEVAQAARVKFDVRKNTDEYLMTVRL